ncbi:hypothetical protein JCM11251_004939 [Rhodosporidiobolus azoricus]
MPSPPSCLPRCSSNLSSPGRLPPGLLNPLPPPIPPSREEALTHLPKLLASLPSASVVGFSDGSLMDGFTGAASAVWTVGFGDGARTRLRVMGGQQTVWAGEAEGAQLTLLTALPLLPLLQPPSLTLLSDDQALLLDPTNPSATPGQHLRLELRALLTRLHHSFLAVQAAEEGARRAEGEMTRSSGAARGHRGLSRTMGRAAGMFRASQSPQESVSSEGSEWGGDEEVSRRGVGVWMDNAQEPLRAQAGAARRVDGRVRAALAGRRKVRLVQFPRFLYRLTTLHQHALHPERSRQPRHDLPVSRL